MGVRNNEYSFSVDEIKILKEQIDEKRISYNIKKSKTPRIEEFEGPTL